jgi:hypothetical protein
MKKKNLILFGILIFLLILLYLVRSTAKTPTNTTTTVPKVITPTSTLQELPRDLEYSQGLNDLHKNYPWYSKLPVETKDYRIIYDFDKQSFRIRILTQSTDQIKQSAISRLKGLGVDLTKFSYYFVE